jgi:hypothetical protein
MGVDYACEKFYSVFNYVVVSTAPVRERLESVISAAVHLQRDDFPDDKSWDRFQKLLKATTKRPARTEHEGTIAATTSRMKHSEARKWIQEALSILVDLHEAYGRESVQGRLSAEIKCRH